ncbi:Membrane-associated enzyme, PAP2 (acid phosphatase) superfamily [Rhizobiales bacterium GAS191]|nr:Membrane-associated enzyme, PAP2 (acid phosphatase) superfamily [Rhizobiales bacterium GAS191]
MKRSLALALLAAFGLVLLMAILAAHPDLDLAIARRFYAMEGESFGARSDGLLIVLRDLGYYLPIALLALACLGWLRGRWSPAAAKVFTGRRILFLALSFAIGPGLIVNAVLKDVSHRPRPAQVEEFGGSSAFRPWYAFDGVCAKNCSFASGEVAGATWLLAPASLAPPAWRALALTGAALFAAVVGVLRMAFGGHFASDVVAAALVTLACILGLGWGLRRRRAAPPL